MITTTSRALAGSLAGCLAAAGLALLPATAAHASPTTDPTLAVLDTLGAPAANTELNDQVNVSVSTPITTSGQTDQKITTSWNPAQFTLAGGTLVRPEGWNLEYTTDGTNWVSSAPALSSVRGVRSTGHVASGGLDDGLQVSTATGTGDVVSGAGTFSGSSGGDGWDAFTTSTYVLNVWHHNGGSYNLDCHLKSSGASCNASVYSVSGFETSPASTGTVVGNNVFSLVGEPEGGTFGIICTDISAIPFTYCGYTPLIAGTGDVYGMGSQTKIGNRLYAPVTANSGKLICFDTNTLAACPGQPYALTGFSALSGTEVPAFSSSAGGYVFVTANEVWCFTASTGAACSGSWPVGSYSKPVHAAVPMRNSSGTLIGACVIYPANNCYGLDGSAATFPPALASLLSAKPMDGGPTIGWGQYGFTSTRQYWLTGSGWSSGMPPVCWDWLTGAACAGFDTTASTGIRRYALTPDATNLNCIWTNGDNGQISSFDAYTGSAGCPGPSPTVLIPYTTVVPRMSCLEAGRVRGYRDLTLTVPNTVTVTNLSVTVVDTDGDDVAGFVGLTPDSSGVIDLSTLDATVTGTHPAFEVTSPNTTTADAKAISAAVRYVSDAPQLCLSLTQQRECPSLSPGVSSTSDLPVASAQVSAVSTITVASVDTPTPMSYQVTRADMPGCLGTVSGTVTRTYSGGSAPLPGSTVRLIRPDLTEAASTTTDEDGDYVFANVNPGTYTVKLGTQTLSKTVVAQGTQDADFTVPVENPTALPVSTSTLQNTVVSLAVNATADPATAIDPTSLRILDPDSEEWVSTLVVDGEGTWVVTVNGSLRFTPEQGFVGTATPVDYRVLDGYGTEATSTAVIAVIPVLPTAAPVAAVGTRGDTLRITLRGNGPKVPLVAGTARLLDPDTQAPLTQVDVDGVGMFEIDSDTGQVVFTPQGTFVGSSSLMYQVTDAVGRVARSSVTVTLNGFTVTGGSRTILVNRTAQVGIAGVPNGSTLSAPATLDGATITTSGRNVWFTGPQNQSGRWVIPVTVTHGTAEVQTQVTITVLPATARGGWYALADSEHTVVRWSVTPGATGYEVRANGHLMCTGSTLSCTIDDLLGPRSKIMITALGADNTRADAVRVDYRVTGCHPLFSVYFGSDSAALNRFATPALNSFSRLLAVQGFRDVCLIGHTDSRGSAAYNLDLSKRRVTAVGNYIGARVGGLAVTRSYRGENDPAGNNNTPGGQAQNRRVDLAVG